MAVTSTEERLTAGAEDEGERLDRFLARRLPQFSRAQAQRLIESGEVLVNNAPSKPSYHLNEGDLVEVDLLAPAPEPPLAEAMPLQVLYEDEALAVIDKPAGLVVHPAHGHEAGTLLNGLFARFPQLQNWPAEEGRPGLVHRLDRDTSGLLLVALAPAVAADLRAQFKAAAVRKVYLALVIGQPRLDRACIEAAIGRDPRERKRMAVVSEGGREAVTEYRVLERLGDYALLEVRPKTGRTHQIRVHLAAIGHPVVGDRVYGPQRQRLRIGRVFLHAGELSFHHPVTGEEMTFRAPLPCELQGVLEELRARAGHQGL